MNRMFLGCAVAALLLWAMAAAAFEIDMTELPQGLSFRPKSRIESYMKDDNFGINEYQRIVGVPHPAPPRPPFAGVQDDTRKALAEFLVRRLLADGFVNDPFNEYKKVSSIKVTTVTVDQLGWSSAHKLAVLRCSSPGSLKDDSCGTTWNGEINFVGFVRTDEAGAPLEVLLVIGGIDTNYMSDTNHLITTVSMATTFEGDELLRVIVDQESYAGRVNTIVTILEDGFNVDKIHVDAWD